MNTGGLTDRDLQAAAFGIGSAALCARDGKMTRKDWLKFADVAWRWSAKIRLRVPNQAAERQGE